MINLTSRCLQRYASAGQEQSKMPNNLNKRVEEMESVRVDSLSLSTTVKEAEFTQQASVDPRKNKD